MRKSPLQKFLLLKDLKTHFLKSSRERNSKKTLCKKIGKTIWVCSETQFESQFEGAKLGQSEKALSMTCDNLKRTSLESTKIHSKSTKSKTSLCLTIGNQTYLYSPLRKVRSQGTTTFLLRSRTNCFRVFLVKVWTWRKSKVETVV